ncbi:MAG: hypothetical protein WAT19_16165 [Ferruginibacter sp.]
MTDPIETISNFFVAQQEAYTVFLPAEEVFAAIKTIPASSGLRDDNDPELVYAGNHSFCLRLRNIFSSRTGVSSRLYGKLSIKGESGTLIETTVKGSPSLYILYFLFSITGLVYLHRYMLMRGTPQDLILAMLALVGLPWLCAWYKKTTDETIRLRFENFLEEKFGYAQTNEENES